MPNCSGRGVKLQILRKKPLRSFGYYKHLFWEVLIIFPLVHFIRSPLQLSKKEYGFLGYKLRFRKYKLQRWSDFWLSQHFLEISVSSICKIVAKKPLYHTTYWKNPAIFFRCASPTCTKWPKYLLLLAQKLEKMVHLWFILRKETWKLGKCPHYFIFFSRADFW